MNNAGRHYHAQDWMTEQRGSISRAQVLLVGIEVLRGKPTWQEMKSWQNFNLCPRNHSKKREEEGCLGDLVSKALDL